MSMENSRYFLNRLNVAVHAYNDLKDSISKYDELIYDYLQVIDEDAYALKREVIAFNIVDKVYKLIDSIDDLIETIYDK